MYWAHNYKTINNLNLNSKSIKKTIYIVILIVVNRSKTMNLLGFETKQIISMNFTQFHLIILLESLA